MQVMPFATAPIDVEPWLAIIRAVALAFFSLIGIGVVGLAIYIGFKMATATDDSKRKDAKKQLIYAIIGVLGIVIIIVLWETVLMDMLLGVATRTPGGS